jgi:hypothetical protein
MSILAHHCGDLYQPKLQQGTRLLHEHLLEEEARQASPAWAAWIQVAAAMEYQALAARALVAQTQGRPGARHRRILRGPLAVSLQCSCPTITQRWATTRMRSRFQQPGGSIRPTVSSTTTRQHTLRTRPRATCSNQQGARTRIRVSRRHRQVLAATVCSPSSPGEWRLALPLRLCRLLPDT